MTSFPRGPLSPAAREQQLLWGSNPSHWARFAEPHTRPLFEAVLAATSVTAGTRLLDAGCGSGLLLELAAARGAIVTGLDVSPGLLAAARDRVPDAELWLGDLQELPFPNDVFGAVTGVNAFQFAGDPLAALREAGRVCQPDGIVAASTFARPDRVESTAVHEAMSALSPPQRQAEHAPYSLSAPGGRKAVAAAIEKAVVPFTDPATGVISMRNVFRWVSARRP
jgi:SAM-dependent methyltransferase